MQFYSDPRAVVATLNAVWEANDLDATMALFAEDAVWVVHAHPSAPHVGRWEGREGIRQTLIELRSVFEYVLYRPRIVSCTGEKVFVTIEFIADHKATGERLHTRFRQEFIVRSGLVASCTEFYDVAMLEAFMRLFVLGPPVEDNVEPDDTA